MTAAGFTAAAALVLAVGGADHTNGGSGAKLPAAYLGNWSSDPEMCGRAEDDSHMAVSSREIMFYEDAVRLSHVRRRSGSRVTALAESLIEAPAPKVAIELELSADRQKLTLHMGGSATTRIRCPARGSDRLGS